MTKPNAFIRILHRRLTPVVGLLLLVMLFVGGTHHHADGGRHACAACTVVHSPAVATAVIVGAAAPQDPQETVPAHARHAPRPARLATASTRAPPQA